MNAECNEATSRACRGYTYVGVLLLLALIGLASALTVSVGALMQQRSNEEELLFVGAQYANAFRTYSEATPAGQRPFPAKLEELLRDPRYPGIRRHLRRMYVDPITGASEWGHVAAPGGGLMGVHSLSQRAPIKVAGFDPPFIGLGDKNKYSEWHFGFIAGNRVPAGMVVPAGATPSTTGTAPTNPSGASGPPGLLSGLPSAATNQSAPANAPPPFTNQSAPANAPAPFTK